MPQASNLHIDRFLTNLSIAYLNEEYIADQVAIPLPVDHRTDKYVVYDRAAFIRASGTNAQGLPKSLRSERGTAYEVDYALSNDSFAASEYARRDAVTDEEVLESDAPLEPFVDATTNVTELLKMDNEMGVASVACKTTNYNSSNKVLLTTGGTGTSWAQYASANSLPLSNLRDGIVAIRKGIFRRPNMALYSLSSAQILADHPDIKDLIKYTSTEALTMAGLPPVIRGLTTLEGTAQHATSNEGAATLTTGDVWANENGLNICLIYYKNAEVSKRSVQFMRAFDAPNAGFGGSARGMVFRRYREEAPKLTWVEGCMTRDWKMVSKDVNGANGKSIAGYEISGTDL